MKNNFFDHIIKEKIKDIKAPSETPDWDYFSTLLEKSTTDDIKFDAEVKNKIKDISFRNNSSHWVLLKNQLQIIEYRRKSIFTSKALEILGVFLIVLTLVNITKFETIEEKKPMDPTLFAQNNNLKTSKQKFEKKILKSSKKESQKGNNIQNNYSTVDYSKINSTVMNSAQINPISGDLTQNEYSFKNLTIQEIIVVLKDNVVQNNEPLQNITESVSNVQVETKEYPISELNNTINEDNTSFEHENATNSVQFLPTDLELLEGNKPDLVFSKNEKSKNKTYLTAWYGQDVNLINTPFDRIYALSSYSKEALNSSFGALVSKRLGKFEVETGLSYSKRSYEPKSFTEPFRDRGNYNYEISLDKINYDVASIPIQLKHHTFSGKGWSVYGMLGINANLIMDAKYDITERIVPRNVGSRSVPEKPLLNKKPFIDGILKGDNVKENMYLTANFGFGVDKSLTKTTSFFMQPTYSRHLSFLNDGIGPNQDKIHTSSILFGIKTAL